MFSEVLALIQVVSILAVPALLLLRSVCRRADRLCADLLQLIQQPRVDASTQTVQPSTRELYLQYCNQLKGFNVPT